MLLVCYWLLWCMRMYAVSLLVLVVLVVLASVFVVGFSPTLDGVQAYD